MNVVTAIDNLKGKYVLVRSSCNVPIKDGVVQNKFRLIRALPTLRYLREQGARVIVVSHIGREPEETLKPVFAELEKYLPMQWGGDVTSDDFRRRCELMGNGDILMAENLRQHEGEAENDRAFSSQLASIAELYVNDAFAEVHREHASTYGVAKLLPAYAGLTLLEEITELQKATKPKHPALFLLGGAKFETKLPLVEKYLEIYDFVFVGGALANDIFKALGYEVGQSLVSETSLKNASFLQNKKLLIPLDVVVDGPEGKQVKAPQAVTKEEKILDCGPLTVEMLAVHIENAKTILWNGPFGAYEQGYTQSTEIIARYIAGASAYSVIGGGDTIAAVEKLKINECFSFVSIGGGSTLTYLEQGTTKAIDLLR